MSKQSDKVFHRNNAHATRNYYNFSTIILLRSNLPKFPIYFALPPVWFFFSPTIVLDPDQGASFSSSLDRITRPFSEIQIKKPLGSCRKPGTVRGHPVTGATKYLLDRCLNHRITNITTVKYFRQVHRRIQAAINHQLFWLLTLLDVIINVPSKRIVALPTFQWNVRSTCFEAVPWFPFDPRLNVAVLRILLNDKLEFHSVNRCVSNY